MTPSSTPGDRLREARTRTGFSSAASAAKAIGVPIATYSGHEANHRGFPAKKAALYAKQFHVTMDWLLFGVEPTPGAAAIRVPVIATVDSGETLVRSVNGPATNQTVLAPPTPPGIRYAFTLAHDAMHMFAGWTLYGEEKTERLSEVTEDRLCMIGLTNGSIVLAKPRKATADGLYHLYFFGEVPRTDVRIAWVSRIVASHM